MFAEEITHIKFIETDDRYIERLQSEDPSQIQNARGHDKTLTKKKAQILRKMDEYIQIFIKDNLGTITSKMPLAKHKKLRMVGHLLLFTYPKDPK